jgi:hypothetical protein
VTRRRPGFPGSQRPSTGVSCVICQLDAEAGAYLGIEVANASSLQALEQDVLGVVQAGGAGGLLIGNGGTGGTGLGLPAGIGGVGGHGGDAPTGIGGNER